MKKILFVLALLFVSCGKSTAPEIATPSEGQVFDLNNFQPLQVTMINNEFEDVTIEFRGINGELAKELRCDNTTNSPYAQCYKLTQNQFGGGGFGQSCTPQAPCTVFIIATRNGSSTFRTVQIQRGTQAPSQPPRAEE